MPKLSTRDAEDPPLAPPSFVERCSYRASDLARCLAEAIREPSDAPPPPRRKNKSKKPSKRRGKKKNKDVFNGQFGRRKSVDENENNLIHSYSSMVYSEVVRNSILRKIDLSNILPPSSISSKDSSATVNGSSKCPTGLTEQSKVLNELNKMYNEKANEDTNKLISDKAILDRNLSENDVADLAKLECDLKNLPDFELIEDATWEVVSLSDCSTAYSSDDDFQLLTDEEDDDEALEKGSHECSEEKDEDRDEPKSDSDVNPPPKKKYIAATRKFIGGADFEDKMEKLEFEDDGEDENGCHHYSGEFMHSLMSVEVTSRCGVRVVSVRCLSENILQCLNTLHCLMKATGLNSYSNVSIPTSEGK